MDPVFLFVILALILSIVIHEAAHGYMADMLGDPTARLQGRLTLNPLRHIDPLGSIIIPGILVLTQANILFGWAKPVPYNPYNLRNQKWGEALVAAAGPGVNIFLALFFGLLIRTGIADAVSPLFATLIWYVVHLNVLLAFFNLIPIPPLDGSKILKALLPLRGQMAFARFEAFTAQYGFLVLFLFIFLFMSVAWPYFAQLVMWVEFAITGRVL